MTEKEKCTHEKFEVNRHDIPHSYSVACLGCGKNFNSVHAFVKEIRQQSELAERNNILKLLEMFNISDKTFARCCGDLGLDLVDCSSFMQFDLKEEKQKGFNEGIDEAVKLVDNGIEILQKYIDEELVKRYQPPEDLEFLKAAQRDNIKLKSSLQNLKRSR